MHVFGDCYSHNCRCVWANFRLSKWFNSVKGCQKKEWAKKKISVYTNKVFHENISVYQNILMMFLSLGFQEIPHFLWHWNHKCSVVWIICTGVQKKSGMFYVWYKWGLSMLICLCILWFGSQLKQQSTLSLAALIVNTCT